MRRSPVIATLIGVVLLAIGLLLSADALLQSRAQRAQLRHDVAQEAASVAFSFERGRSLDLLLAQYAGTLQTSDGTVDGAAADRALTYLEVLYPGAISEACLIDDRGRELARAVHGEAATDLSDDEAANAFFRSTLALPVDQVLQAPPYVSQDTHGWVISNSTWITRPDRSRMIVHFEIDLSSVQAQLRAVSGRTHLAVVERATGRVLLQSGRPLPAARQEASFRTTGWSHALAERGTLSQVDDQPAAVARIDRSIGNANDWYVVEWTSQRASLVPLWVGAALALSGLIALATGVVVLRRQQAALRAAARLDHLTGLVNARTITEALGEALRDSTQAAGAGVSVLLLDLDGFKQINDSLGHAQGDAVLKEIGRRLHANTFEYDVAGRLGGDEFVVVLRRLRDSDDVHAVAHRLREALIRPIELHAGPRLIGVSIGAASWPEHGTTVEELLRNADAAMYAAKRGRTGVRVHDAETMDNQSAEKGSPSPWGPALRGRQRPVLT